MKCSCVHIVYYIIVEVLKGRDSVLVFFAHLQECHAISFGFM